MPTVSLNLTLQETLNDELETMAKNSNASKADLVRIGLGLVHILYTAYQDGYRVALIDEHGKPVKEIAVPLEVKQPYM